MTIIQDTAVLRMEAKMANGTKEFDFKRCPYCGAVYIDSDCVGTILVPSGCRFIFNP